MPNSRKTSTCSVSPRRNSASCGRPVSTSNCGRSSGKPSRKSTSDLKTVDKKARDKDCSCKRKVVAKLKLKTAKTVASVPKKATKKKSTSSACRRCETSRGRHSRCYSSSSTSSSCLSFSSDSFDDNCFSSCSCSECDDY